VPLSIIYCHHHRSDHLHRHHSQPVYIFHQSQGMAGQGLQPAGCQGDR
jgi:hypothetical protein